MILKSIKHDGYSRAEIGDARHMLLSMVQRKGPYEYVIGLTAANNTEEVTLTMSRDEAAGLARRINELVDLGGSRPAIINVQPV